MMTQDVRELIHRVKSEGVEVENVPKCIVQLIRRIGAHVPHNGDQFYDQRLQCRET